MADIYDQASDLEASHNEAAVAAARYRNKPEQVQNKDGTWPVLDCIDCGEPIEEQPVHLGRVRCFQCQSLMETRATRFKS